MHLKTRWLVLLGLAGLLLVGWLAWAIGHTEPPPWPVMLADVIAVVGLAVTPWLVLSGRQLLRAGERDPQAGTVYTRVVVIAGLLAFAGPVTVIVFSLALGGRDPTPGVAAGVAVLPIVAGGAVALLGGVLFPWLFVLARTLTRERAARARAEERAEVAAHLHDTVLQALTLIQKSSAEPGVLRLARRTERELRSWLYGGPSPGGDDFAAAVSEAVQEVEDRYAVAVELVTVGTCPLDERARAVLGALREALTNAGKHAGTRHLSVFAEVADGEVYALVRDRGRGFDTTVHNGGRGIADSIEGRMRQHGGAVAIQSATGSGTEVELRMPVP